MTLQGIYSVGNSMQLFLQISVFLVSRCLQNHHNGVDYLRLYLPHKRNKIYSKAIKKKRQLFEMHSTQLCLYATLIEYSHFIIVHINLNIYS